jgi:hypothetical protein
MRCMIVYIDDNNSSSEIDTSVNTAPTYAQNEQSIS